MLLSLNKSKGFKSFSHCLDNKRQLFTATTVQLCDCDLLILYYNSMMINTCAFKILVHGPIFLNIVPDKFKYSSGILTDGTH